MARFSEEWLSRLLEKSDIVDVVSAYVPLNKKGTRYWANCPWHHERNASFSVNPEKQMFYCFSCKKGGGVINFIMEMEKLSYIEAVTMLAERAGIELPEASEDTGYQKRREYAKRLCAMMRELALHYNQNLHGPEGKKALLYLQKRQVETEITPFGLGYAKDSFDDALRFLKGKGYTLKEMLDAGVIKQREGRTYDMFRDRVIFPIQNVFGDVIAFGGRVLGDGEPKYLNSSETVIFNKRQNLYALNTVKKRRNLKKILLVEGYMDVVALSAAGVKSAVASLGTSLTQQQARLLKRYVGGVYLCYDGDKAGQNAALRGSEILEKEGLQVLVMSLPGGMDPDEFVKKYGTAAFYDQAKKACPATHFRILQLQKDYDMSRSEEVIAFATKAVELVAGLPNELEKEHYIHLLAKLTGLSSQSLLAQMGKGGGVERYNIPENELNLIKKEAGDQEKLISLVMEKTSLISKIAGLDEALFDKDLHKKIILWIIEQIKKGILPTCAEIVSEFSSESADLGELAAISLPEDALEDYAETLIGRIRAEKLQRQRADLLKLLAEEKDEPKRRRLMERVSELNKQMHRLSDQNFRR